MQNSAIVQGSLNAIALEKNKSISQVFTNVNYIILVDTSGSMLAEDTRDKKSRYASACEELVKLQKRLPGRIAVFSFSDSCFFEPNGVPRLIGNTTNLADALRYTKVADGAVDYFVISDGYPDDPEVVLEISGEFLSSINTVFIGPESNVDGAEFMRTLAKKAKGKSEDAFRTEDMYNKLTKLLLT